MIGAGVFSAFAPAAREAGSGLLVALVIAAFVAWCNATSSAQLAVAHPRAGGTYLYGRAELGPWWGFAAGWGFVIGKTASCAAMALTFAAYAVPGHEKLAAAAVVVVLTLVNCAGITRTAALTRLIVVLVLIGLAVAVVACLTSDQMVGVYSEHEPTRGLLPYLQAAGLLFFAFAGYARIATLGEEVRDPERVIPRAIVIALGGAIVVYALVGIACLAVLGPGRLAWSVAPLVDALRYSGHSGLVPVVRVAAALASAGALLALGAGVGRTALAMARERDLPSFLTAVHPRFGVPHRAELLVGTVVVALVLTTDLRHAIGFSSFGVLVYYFVANLAAHRQSDEVRRYPRAIQVLGAIGCALLVVALPWKAVLAGIAVLAVGVALRAARLALDGSAARP